jgi:hypothetical protein
VEELNKTMEFLSDNRSIGRDSNRDPSECESKEIAVPSHSVHIFAVNPTCTTRSAHHILSHVTTLALPGVHTRSLLIM